jgi:hypothetical protein
MKNLLHLNLVLLVVVFSTTSGVLGGAWRGQEQNLGRRGLRKQKELDPYRMNSSKTEARASSASRRQGRNHKGKASSVSALEESALHLNQPFREEVWQQSRHASPL